MTSDLDTVPSIASIANGKTVGGELGFTFPDVLEAIRLCTTNGIAILGVEILEVRGETYVTTKMSAYELADQEWDDYVSANNALAEEFVKSNPSGDQHIYVLTTSSWREFCKIQEMKNP
jgi:hypothetical protein